MYDLSVLMALHRRYFHHPLISLDELVLQRLYRG